MRPTRWLWLSVLLLAPLARAGDGLPQPRLQHTVWLGPGCDQFLEMDVLYEMVGALIQETGVRPAERFDRLELECFGTVVSRAPRFRAYATARVTITRAVPYRGDQGRLLLNRDSYGVELESSQPAGVVEPFRRALRGSLRQALKAYGRGSYSEVVAGPLREVRPTMSAARDRRR